MVTELTYEEALAHVEKGNDHIWFRYRGNRLGWWVHGRSHGMQGTDYYDFEPISEETALSLWRKGEVHPLHEPPGDPHYEQFRQPDGTWKHPSEVKDNKYRPGQERPLTAQELESVLALAAAAYEFDTKSRARYTPGAPIQANIPELRRKLAEKVQAIPPEIVQKFAQVTND